MSEKIVNIARNTSYYTLALVIQKIISFSYFVIIARALGPADLGKYYFALSFTTIFAIFIDLGLSNVLTRETAKTPARGQALISNVLAIKIPLALISFSAVIILINLLGYPQLTKELVYLSSISMLLDSFTLSFFAIARGFHNLSFESIASVVFQLIVLMVGLLTLKLGLGIRALMSALVLASVFNFSYSALIVWRRWRIKIYPKVEPALLKIIINIAIPFALFGIYQRVYLYLDTVLLSLMAGDKEVGLYQIAFKIIFALQFLPLAFSASLYPAFSAYWAKNRQQLAITFERAMNYLIIISLPVSIGIITIADKVVLLFREGYAESILPLRISMISVVFSFLLFAVGSLLNACDRQKSNTRIMALATAISVIMNLLLIPHFKAVGASITAAFTNFLMLTLGLAIVPQIMKYNYYKIIKIFLKTLLASSLMSLLALYLKNQVNIFLVVALSATAYLIMLLLLGSLKKEDLLSVWQSFKNKTA